MILIGSMIEIMLTTIIASMTFSNYANTANLNHILKQSQLGEILLYNLSSKNDLLEKKVTDLCIKNDFLFHKIPAGDDGCLNTFIGKNRVHIDYGNSINMDIKSDGEWSSVIDMKLKK